MIRLLLLLFLAGASGGAEPALSGGRFTLFLAGRDAGSEVVTVTRRGGEIVVESRVSLFRDDREQDLRLEMALDPDSLDVLRLSARGVSGDVEVVVTYARHDGALAGEVREGEKARSVTLDLPPGAIPLLDPFSAPFLLVASRYDRDRGTPAHFPAFYPLEGRVGEVGVVGREAKAILLDGRAELATRLFATPDGADAANLWVDPAGRLLVCARSVAGLSAVRGEEVRIGLAQGEDPPPPEGVQAFRVRFSAEAGVMAGTFYRPARGEGPWPAALLLSGSGPQDRNGNAPGSELQWNFLTSFADALARAGVASLRYDERGVGRSGGSFADAGVSGLLGDARDALEFLKSRDDVDPDRIALLGHSEGALLAALLAGREESPARAVVLVGPPAEPLDRILLRQIRERLAGREMEERERQRVLGDLRAYFEHVRLSRGDTVTWQGRTRSARWLREHMEIDPLETYRRVAVPALVLQGGRDAQVEPDGAVRVAGALGEATLLRAAALDHFLMPGRGDLRDYADATRRVDATVLSRVSGWVRGALRAR